MTYREFQEDAEALNRGQLEAYISSSFQHPNIVEMYSYSMKRHVDAGSGGPASQHVPYVRQVYLVMEYCREGSLQEATNAQRFWLAAAGTPDLRGTVELATQVGGRQPPWHGVCATWRDVGAAWRCVFAS